MNPFLAMAVQRSVALLQANQPMERPYWGAFSGGKDSVVIKELARIAGVRIIWHYHQTTIDPPELIAFLREQHPDVVWEKPPHGNLFHRFAVAKTFPNRRFRWCCDEYKERTPEGETSIVGIRVAESSRRRSRYTRCVMDDDRPHHRHTKVMPIRLWSDEDVWEFIRFYKVPYCGLYDEGWKRLGCVGCPLVKPEIRLAEFKRWPRYEQGWHRAFERFWLRMKAKEARTGKPWRVGQRFGDVERLWDAWVNWLPWPDMPPEAAA